MEKNQDKSAMEAEREQVAGCSAACIAAKENFKKTITMEAEREQLAGCSAKCIASIAACRTQEFWGLGFRV